MSEIVIVSLIVGVTLSAPILWCALGEIIAEKAGILNVGIEGVMLFGAFSAALGLLHFSSWTGAVLASLVGGIACGLILMYLYVLRGTDQIVTGILFSLLMYGFTFFLFERLLTGGIPRSMDRWSIPLLSQIPILGRVIFTASPMMYFAVLAAPLIYFFLKKSWLGMNIRAVGESALSAESAGINVLKVRSLAIIIACALAGLGGGTLVILTSGGFVPGMTAGRGFIALGVVILARWNAVWAIGAALIFGIAQAMQFQIGQIPLLSNVPSQFTMMLPYLITILVVGFVRGTRYPAEINAPFVRGAAA